MATLLLNKQELSEILAILWRAKEEATDDDGVFLSGALTTGIIKLNEQFTLRFGAGVPEPLFKLTELEAEFAASDEIFSEDVSEVHIEAVLDTHFDAPEVEISIYGAGGPSAEDFPMIHRVIDGSLLAPPELLEAGLPVSVERVIRLFDLDCLKILADRQVPLLWNPGWTSAATIRPEKPDTELLLRLEAR